MGCFRKCFEMKITKLQIRLILDLYFPEFRAALYDSFKMTKTLKYGVTSVLRPRLLLRLFLNFFSQAHRLRKGQ